VPTLLIGWELGGGGGHIHRLVPIIGHYLERGWTIIAALRLRQAGQALFARRFAASLADGRLTVVQAPIFLHRSRGAQSASSLVEIFAHIGFAEAELWMPVVSAWERLIALHRPDAIISDIAPSLNLAASGRLPLIVIGNGWTIPPDIDGPVTFSNEIDPRFSANAAAERVVETASKVTRGRHSSGRFSDLLRGKANMVCTLQALDPYEKDRHEQYFWPFEIPAVGGEPKTRERGFIYLPQKHPALSAVLAAVAAGDLEFDAYLDGYQPTCRNLRVAEQPLDLPRILPKAVLAIHHGGLGTAIECWVDHVPQLVLPLDTEKMIVGRGVAEARAGGILRPDVREHELQAMIEKVVRLSVSDPDCSRMATTRPEESLNVLSRQTE
jgi:hypothetical protein